MLWRRHNSSSSSKSPDTEELVTCFSLSYFSFSLTCPSYFPPSLSLSFRFPILSFLAIMSGVGPEKTKKKEDDILDTTFFMFWRYGMMGNNNSWRLTAEKIKRKQFFWCPTAKTTPV